MTDFSIAQETCAWSPVASTTSPGFLERIDSRATQGSARVWDVRAPCEVTDVRHTRGLFREPRRCTVSQPLRQHHTPLLCFGGHGAVYQRRCRGQEGTERPGYLAQDLGICPGSNPAPPNDRAPLSSRFLKLPPERMAGRLPAPPAALADGKSARWDSREAERSEAHIGLLLGKQACGVGKDI